ncbi:MAG: divergent polysaccharide deacetylase family protein [Pseudomonadota bacterium]
MIFNCQIFKNNKKAIITIILSLIILIILAFVFFIKKNELIYKAEIAKQKIIVSLTRNEMILNEGPDPIIKENDDGKPIIAILVEGLDVIKALDILSLPKEINFGFISQDSKEIENSLLKEHNLMINVPLQDDSYDENSLRFDNSLDINQKLLYNILDNLEDNQGIYTNKDEVYTNSFSETEWFLKILQKKNVIFLCGKQDKSSLVYQLAEKSSFHILANDLILDEIISEEYINGKLEELEKLAIENGSAIATTSPLPLTIEILKNWAPKLEQKGIRILSIKDFYNLTLQRKNQNIKKVTQ